MASLPLNIAPPKTSQWIYSEIMRFIEPELLVEAIPTLPAKYLGETKAERLARMERYERAFKQYDEAYDRMMRELGDSALQWKVQARSQLRSQENAEHQHDLQSAEDSFSTQQS